MRWSFVLLGSACAPVVSAEAPAPAHDLLAPPAALALSTTDLVPGQAVTFTAAGAGPRDRVSFVLSIDGLGPGPCTPAGLCLDIGPRTTLLGTVRADATGTARLDARVPTTAAPGLVVGLQAGVVGRGLLSNPLLETVLSGGPGLSARPANPTCLAPPRPPAAGSATLQPVYQGVSLSLPTAMVQAPGDPSWWYTIELGGRIVRFPSTTSTTTLQVVADLTSRVRSGGELGLLSLAFDPANPDDLYVYYTTGASPNLRSRISRLTTSNGGATFGSETTVLEVPQPFTNHNGGTLQFGADGYLYFAFGDGGSANDPGNRAQDPSTLLGKMIRIDVSGGLPYAIPADNPWAQGGALGEIWAVGLRNPYRWAFDQETGRAWVGDVGQDAREEISVVERGANEGWRVMEGTRCANPTTGLPPCGDPVYAPPVWEIPHGGGAVSVIGGYVYRGSTMPWLDGTYLFAEFYSGTIRGLFPDATGGLQSVTVAQRQGLQVSSFAEALDGTLYVLDYGGAIYRLDPPSGPTPPPFPQRLSQTGCFEPSDPTQPLPALVPYQPRSELWSDGLDKERWLALPDGATITVEQDGDWTLPVGSVLIKTFSHEGVRVETRFLVRHDDGGWGAYTWRWLPDGSDAVLLSIGEDVPLPGGLTWTIPAASQCGSCHTSAAGSSLGLESAQLNSPLAYGDRWANQLSTLDALGLLSAPIGDPRALPALATLEGPAHPEAKSRSYLHGNCAMCHRPGGGGLSDMDLRASVPLAQAQLCDVPGTDPTGTLVDPKRLAPGEPELSTLWLRLATASPDLRMPPLGTRRVHERATDVVAEWITALAACP